MARKRASMREGPLAELFKATEAAQKQADSGAGAEQPSEEDVALDETVEYTPEFARGRDEPEQAPLPASAEPAQPIANVVELPAVDERQGPAPAEPPARSLQLPSGCAPTSGRSRFRSRRSCTPFRAPTPVRISPSSASSASAGPG